MKVRLFFEELGLVEPDLDEVRRFRAIYKPAYRTNQRATPGSFETLVRLREHGYRLAIVANGQVEIQTSKAEAIGVRHLVDRIITSEEVGCCKPDRYIFEFAVNALGASPHSTCMVGDSADTDIKGAVDIGIDAILYSPIAKKPSSLGFGMRVSVIGRIDQLLQHLNITDPKFEPEFVSVPGQLLIDGLGIDFVTEPRHCLHMTMQNIFFLASAVGKVL